MGWKEKFPKKGRYYETKNGILYHGDCLEIMKEFPKESIDLVITDPPYGVGSKERNGIGYKDEYFDVEEFNNLAFTILKDNTRLYLFIAQKTFCETVRKMSSFSFHQTLIWYKPNYAGGGKRVYDFTCTHEFILLFHKGKPGKLNNPRLVSSKYLSNRDVLEYTQPQSNFRNDRRYHVHQKPLLLLEHLIIASSNEQDLILDPFIGSGTTALACEKLNRRWIGIEINEEYCKMAKERLSKMNPLRYWISTARR